MKKLITIFTFIFLCLNFAQAQTPEFAPLGAKWTYHMLETVFGTGKEGILKFECIDTIHRDGKVMKVVAKKEMRQKIYYSGTVLLYTNRDTIIHPVDSFYEENDTVFIYNRLFSKYTPLYIYNAQPGNIITIPAFEIPNLFYVTQFDSTITFVVDSIKTVNYNGTDLKTFYTSFKYSLIDYVNSDTYIKTKSPIVNWITGFVFRGVSSYQYAFPLGAYAQTIGGLGSGLVPETYYVQILTDIPFYLYDFDCYEEGSTQIKQSNRDCDSFIVNGNTTGINEGGYSTLLALYPNPAKDNLLIALDKEIKASVGIAIYDLNGRTVYNMTQKVNSDYLKIDVSNLHSGIYFLKISDGGNSVGTMKFIKE